ncbi:hypothetical protein [Actinokineospora enzanensis]|uniref:hypothetical protein n=1 Tax=Actinokineospora enzanensis TaxID=155975 RepID=UPI0003778CAF|nr:hypothetical protein [Actinokineospora enzanensis]
MTTEPLLRLVPGPLPVRKRRLFRWVFLPISTFALGGILLLLFSGTVLVPFEGNEPVEGITGSKGAFFNDDTVKRELLRHHIKVHVTDVGSRSILARDFAGVDFAFPSGAPAAQQIKQKAAGAARDPVRVFTSPLVLATFREFAETLQAAGVATPQDAGPGSLYYKLDMAAFLDLVDEGKRWSTLSVQDHNGGRRIDNVIVAQTSDFCSANSASSYLTLVAYARGAQRVPTDVPAAERLGGEIKNLLDGQGRTDDALAGTYLADANVARTKPIVVIYEHQYLEHQIRRSATPAGLDRDRVLLYPDIQLIAEPEFIPLSDRGEALGSLLAGDEVLRTRAVELGYQLNTVQGDAESLNRLLDDKHIPIPPQINSTVGAPGLDELEAMIKAVSPCRS